MSSKMSVAIFGAVAGFVFLCIALPTYLMGCNQDVSTVCIAYNPFSGYVYKTEVEKHTCSECTSRDKKGNCQTYRYYDCWDAYVWAHKGPSNSSTCYLQVANDDKSKGDAEGQANNYYNNEKVNWLQKKGTHECVTHGEAYTLWLVGIIFFSFMGFAFLCTIIALLWEFMPSAMACSEIELPKWSS